MAVITIEYNPRNVLAQKTLDYIRSLGVFKFKEEDEKEQYNPEFVKMVKEAAAGPKRAISREEIREIMGL